MRVYHCHGWGWERVATTLGIMKKNRFVNAKTDILGQILNFSRLRRLSQHRRIFSPMVNTNNFRTKILKNYQFLVVKN